MEEFAATHFCGHEHICHTMQPTAATRGRAWQGIAGAGGSPFQAKPGESVNPNDRQSSWALVKGQRSGRVVMGVSSCDEQLGPMRRLERIELGGPTQPIPARSPHCSPQGRFFRKVAPGHRFSAGVLPPSNFRACPLASMRGRWRRHQAACEFGSPEATRLQPPPDPEHPSPPAMTNRIWGQPTGMRTDSVES